MPSLQHITPIFPTADMDAMRDHYEALGFDVHVHGGGYGTVARDDIRIHFKLVPDMGPATERGAAYVTVVHGDLPTASGIGALEHFDGVTIAPDRRRTGTNLLRVPTASGFAMRFGRDSLRAHLDECERRSLETWVLDRDDLAFDVDEPEDLASLGERNRGTP